MIGEFGFSDGTDSIGPEKLEFASKVKDKAHGYGFVYFEQPLSSVDMSNPKVKELFKKKLDKKQVELFKKTKDGKEESWFRAPRFVFDYTHFTEATGRFRCLTKKESEPAVCCQQLGKDQKTKRKPRILTLVVESNLDKDGDIKTPLSANWELRILPLTQKVYDAVKSNNNKHPLLVTDYFLTCVNPDYNDYTVAVGSGGATWRSDPEIERQVIDLAEQHWTGLDYLVGKHMKEDEIKEALGLTPVANTNQKLSEEQQKQYDSVLDDDDEDEDGDLSDVPF